MWCHFDKFDWKSWRKYPSWRKSLKPLIQEGIEHQIQKRKKNLKTYTDFHFIGGLEQYLHKISSLSWQTWADPLFWNGRYWSRELWQPRSGAHCLRKAAYLWYLGLWSLWSWRYMITCWGKEFLFTEIRWVLENKKQCLGLKPTREYFSIPWYFSECFPTNN